MKKHSILLLSIFTVVFGCKTQNKIPKSNFNAFDTNSLVDSKGISENIDSLINNKFKPINSQLQTTKSQSEIENLLIGNWTGNIRSRINGKDKQKIDNSIFHFSSNFYFSETIKGDTLTGEFLIQVDSTNNLVLIYDEPQYPYPKDIFDKMSKQELEQIAYQVRLLNIFEINKQSLIFYNIIPIIDYTNPQTITHSRLILEEYVKK